MNYLSVCSGVEAASQAWEPLGWTPVAFAEIEPFPCAVLASRFPNVPNLGDMSKIHYNRETKELTNGTVRLVCDIDLLVGGTPCQSFSVAGKRAGLEGASGLAYHYARLLGEIQPRWFVWENVPGALSSVTYGDQRDFNFLLQQFAVGGDAALGCRWDLCWRVLDTQYVRVERWPRAIPQRRRRVFVVGRLAADGGRGCEVLLEPEGVRGHPPPRRIKGEGAAGDPADRARGTGREVECLTPSADHPQTHRVYGTGGAYPSIMCNGGQAGQDQSGVLVRDAISFKGGQSAAGGLGVDEGACQTMQSKMSAIEPTVAISFDPSPRECLKRQHLEIGDTLKNGTCPGHHNAVAIGFDPYNSQCTGAVIKTLNTAVAQDADHTGIVAIGIGRDAFNSGANAQMAQSISREVQPPMTAKGPGGVCVNGEPRKETT